MSSLLLKAAQQREQDALGTETFLQPLTGRNGYVFGFWQVKPAKEMNEAFSLLLEDHLRRFAQGFGPGANIQHRFEQFLRALNDAIAAHVRDGAWSIPIRHLHALVGIACDDLLFFSGTGDLSALYLHRQPSGHYQVYNLFRGIQTEQALLTWEKAFAVVLDGDLHPGDVLCVSNQDVQRALGPEELLRCLTALPPASAAEKIRHGFGARTDVGLLILQAQDAGAPILPRAIPQAGASVDRLIATETETERLLEDQRPNPFSALKARFFPPPAQATAGTRRPLGVRFVSVCKTVLRFVLLGWQISKRLARQLAKVRSAKEAGEVLQRQGDGIKERLLARVRRVPRSSRFLFVGAVALVLALVIGIETLAHGQAQSKAASAYAAEVSTIEGDRDQAAADLIYHDESRASTLYQQAETLLASLPTNTPARSAQAASLQSDIQTGLNQVRHVMDIPHPAVAADLSVLASGATGTSLIEDSGTLYAFGSDKHVYRYDATQKSFVQLAGAQGGVGVAQSVTDENGTVLFLDDRPGISSFDPVSFDEQITDLAPPANTNWSGLDLYGSRLYVLAPQVDDGQILRFSKTGSGYGPATNWVTSSTVPLSDATDLAIDGTVFVLKKDGSIVRFAQGSQVSWTNAAVDPPVTNATRLWTDDSSNFVYELDPAGQRLIVYAKSTGALVVQYHSTAFTDLTDFAVDETAKTIYLLCGSKLYVIPATHLP